MSITFYHGEAVLTMDTNQIAAAVKSGQADVMTLWEAVRRFTHDRAYRWERALGSRCGVTVDDLTQTGFLALLDALETWKPEAGAFLALLDALEGWEPRAGAFSLPGTGCG